MINKSLKKDIYLNKKLIKNIINTICSNSINTYILGGPPGLGKSDFISKLAKFILCHFENETSIDTYVFESIDYSLDKVKKNKSFYLFESNTHPDFFNLTINDKSDVKKTPIDEVRNLKSFFYKTYSVSKVKIAVINKVEDLSVNSLNLLLKTIEELPEKSYIFIISDDPVNIIETIKSRCALFYVNPLNQMAFNDFLKNEYNEKSEQEILFLNNVCFGSPGVASKVVKQNVYGLYEDILDDLINSNSFLNFRESIIASFNAKENDFLLKIINLIINDIIKKTIYFNEQKNYLDFTLNKEKELINKIINKNNPLKLLNLHSQIDKNMYFANLVNLNKSDILIDSFKDLCGI